MCPAQHDAFRGEIEEKTSMVSRHFTNRNQTVQHSMNTTFVLEAIGCQSKSMLIASSMNFCGIKRVEI